MNDDELSIIIRRFFTAFIPGQRVVSAPDYPFTLVAEEKSGCFERDGNFFHRKKEAHPIHRSKRKGSEYREIDALSWNRRVIQLDEALQ
jgi:hypothetical protein